MIVELAAKRGKIEASATPDSARRTSPVGEWVVRDSPWVLDGIALMEGSCGDQWPVIEFVRGCTIVATLSLSLVEDHHFLNIDGVDPLIYPVLLWCPPRQNLTVQIERLRHPVKLGLYYRVVADAPRHPSPACTDPGTPR